MKRTVLLLALAALLLLAGSTLAMESDNYQLAWFTPLTSGGGGAASSTNYAINLTVGQTAIQASSSANYGACLGYWCGAAEVEYEIFLPLLMRD
jgi:peptidoglycan/LPS O-acetylase OafA/YrhL